MKRLAAIAILLLASTAALSQSTVRQSGSITPNHAVKWLAPGVIGDAGTASSGGLSSLGIMNNGPGGFCINSGPITGGYNRLCFGATTDGGTIISSYALGGATTPGVTIDTNGVLMNLPLTAGSAGDCLKSGGGGSAVMTYGACGGGGGVGTVTSVAFSVPGTSILGISGSPITSSGTLALTTTGTSGGIPYFSSTSQLATSAALTANLPVIGGGAGAAPSVGSRSGNTTTFVTTTGSLTSGRCVELDASGNAVQSGAACNNFTPAALTKTDDTNVTLTLGGTPTTSLLQATSLTLGWTGTLSVPRGGTGAATFTSNLPLLGNSTGAIAQGTRSGNTTTFATTNGAMTSGDCVSIDANGNFVAAGGACTTGGGGGTVNAGTAGQLTYYGTSSTTVSGNPNVTVSAGALTIGVAGSVVGSVSFGNATAGTTKIQPSTGDLGASVLTLPLATDTLVGKATTDTLTNKTYDTAGTGNSFSINGVAATANTGTGAVARATSPTFLTPTLGVATATTINGNTFTTGTYTLTGSASKTLTFSNSLTLAGTDSTTMTFPSVSATITRTVASGAKTLATALIASAACTSAQTDTATGTATTDVVQASFNGDPTAVTGYVPLTSGMLTIIAYPTADTVNFKVCNNTASAITPGAVTINWRVTR